MKKKKESKIFEPALYVFISIIGLVFMMIPFFFEFDDYTFCGKCVSLSSDLGVGLFPTGLIGFILAVMEKRNKEISKFEQRESLLKNVRIELHNFLNVICNNKIAEKPNLINQNVNIILEAVCDEEISDRIPLDNEINALHALSMQIEELVVKSKEMLLAFDVFSNNELEYFILIVEQESRLRQLCAKCQWSESHSTKKAIITSLILLCDNVPELKKYLGLKSDGDNISVQINW